MKGTIDTSESSKMKHTCNDPLGQVLDFSCPACLTALHTGGFDTLLKERLDWARRSATDRSGASASASLLDSQSCKDPACVDAGTFHVHYIEHPDGSVEPRSNETKPECKCRDPRNAHVSSCPFATLQNELLRRGRMDKAILAVEPTQYFDIRCPDCGNMMTDHVVVTRHAASVGNGCNESFTGPSLPPSNQGLPIVKHPTNGQLAVLVCNRKRHGDSVVRIGLHGRVQCWPYPADSLRVVGYTLNNYRGK